MTNLGQALIPLAAKYNLVTRNSSGFTTAAWQNMVVVDGENTFSLWSITPLTTDQINTLTSDLQHMFSWMVKETYLMLSKKPVITRWHKAALDHRQIQLLRKCAPPQPTQASLMLLHQIVKNGDLRD